ncbi:hypothetical protein AB0K00_52020 [Dactylosporangium sp. NPDC049525]|uniref:hypothetical protein n=1 Tax=Dactylosporangium sp. NPDC049525 TaxID=3154730 RepID=UPI0034427946
MVVGAAVVAGALFPDGELAARAAVMAVVVGVYSAKVADPRAVLGVTGVAMLVYVGFLVNDLGELTLRGGTWPFLIPLGFAAVLGWGQHWLRARPPGAGRFDGDGAGLAQPAPDVGTPTTGGSRFRGRQRPPRARLSRARRRSRTPAKARETQGTA